MHYPKLTVVSGVEYTVLLFFNHFLTYPFVNQAIYAHKMIYNTCGSGIYHNPRYILNYKFEEFYNINIGIFSGNETRMDGYFIRTHRYRRMRKVLQDTILSENSSVFLTIKI